MKVELMRYQTVVDVAKRILKDNDSASVDVANRICAACPGAVPLIVANRAVAFIRGEDENCKSQYDRLIKFYNYDPIADEAEFKGLCVKQPL